MSSRKHRGGIYRPFAFTEQGVAMLSSVLRSARAAEVNIAIMRTFVQLRRLMDSNRDLARRIEALERRYDEQFATVFDAIKRLIGMMKSAKPGPSAVLVSFRDTRVTFCYAARRYKLLESIPSEPNLSGS